MILYACVASPAGERILAEHENDAAGSPLSPLAAQCVRAAPRFHSLYTHAVRGRIYAYLMNPDKKEEVRKNQEDNDTDSLVFFAIADEALGREKTLLFLRRLRDSYCKCRKRKRFDILQIVGEVAETKKEKEKPHLPPPPGAAQSALPRGLDLDGGSENVGREKKGKKRKDGEEDQCSSEDGHEMEIAVVDCDRADQHHPRPAFSKRLVENIWRKHVRVVILLDLVICVIMFGIWLTVCRGFQCIAGS